MSTNLQSYLIDHGYCSFSREEMEAIFSQLRTIHSLEVAAESQSKVSKWQNESDTLGVRIKGISKEVIVEFYKTFADQNFNEVSEPLREIQLQSVTQKARDYQWEKEKSNARIYNDPQLARVWRSYRDAKNKWENDGRDPHSKPEKPNMLQSEGLSKIKISILEWVSNSRSLDFYKKKIDDLQELADSFSYIYK